MSDRADTIRWGLSLWRKPDDVRPALAALDALLSELDALRAAHRRVAFKANELAQDGLMAKGTGSNIRDISLAALGAHGDVAIQIIRGDHEPTGAALAAAGPEQGAESNG